MVGARTRPPDHLDIVDGGPSALGDAGYGRRLSDVAIVSCDLADPLGEHAAALAAESEDGDGDAIAVEGHGRVHQAARAARLRACQACRAVITAPRSLERICSHLVG